MARNKSPPHSGSGDTTPCRMTAVTSSSTSMSGLIDSGLVGRKVRSHEKRRWLFEEYRPRVIYRRVNLSIRRLWSMGFQLAKEVVDCWGFRSQCRAGCTSVASGVPARGDNSEHNRTLLIRVTRVCMARLHVPIAIQTLAKGFYSVRFCNLVWSGFCWRVGRKWRSKGGWGRGGGPSPSEEGQARNVVWTFT